MKSLFVVISACLFSMAAWALDLDAAKSQGLVGEQRNGYLGLVVTDNTEAAALVTRINRQRRSHYQGIADTQKTPVANIESIAGDKLVERAAEQGHYHQNSAGRWTR